jgi:hypothetical protein
MSKKGLTELKVYCLSGLVAAGAAKLHKKIVSSKSKPPTSTVSASQQHPLF